MKLTLPLPPSVNAYWRSIVPRRSGGKVRVLVSKVGRKFKDRAALAASAQVREAPLAGPVNVKGTFYFENARGDLDNRLKPLLDVLEGIAFENDRQVVGICIRREIDKENPRVEVEVNPSSRD